MDMYVIHLRGNIHTYSMQNVDMKHNGQQKIYSSQLQQNTLLLSDSLDRDVGTKGRGMLACKSSAEFTNNLLSMEA